MTTNAWDAVWNGFNFIEPYLSLGTADPRMIIARLIQAGLGLVGIIFLVMIVYAGFLWMASGGNEETTAKARKALAQAVIGLIIILSANSIMRFVLQAFVPTTTPADTSPFTPSPPSPEPVGPEPPP